MFFCLKRLITLLTLAAAIASPVHAADKISPAVAAVTALYRDIAWQAVISKPQNAGPGLLDQGKEQIGKYFDATLTDMIIADKKCTAKGQGICGLDFDPLWNSQDPVGASVAITQGAKPDEVLVTLAYASAKNRKPMVFQMVQAGGGWRISDIRFPGEKKTLKAIL
jgi:hypothetical protein